MIQIVNLRVQYNRYGNPVEEGKLIDRIDEAMPQDDGTYIKVTKYVILNDDGSLVTVEPRYVKKVVK